MTTTISVWAPKGGTGKTTIALTLAAGLAAAGRRVWLVDADAQSSALAWARLADHCKQTPGFTISSAGPPANLRDTLDFLLYDHAPAAIPGNLPGSIVVVPLLLEAASYMPSASAIGRLEEDGRHVIQVVANRVRHDRSEQRALLRSLPRSVPVLGDRAAYARAFGCGQTVWELTGPAVSYARDEAAHLVAQIDPTAGHWRTPAAAA
jgi:chromosome partitioning protein